jgi:hypothetical protein
VRGRREELSSHIRESVRRVREACCLPIVIVYWIAIVGYVLTKELYSAWVSFGDHGELDCYIIVRHCGLENKTLDLLMATLIIESKHKAMERKTLDPPGAQSIFVGW